MLYLYKILNFEFEKLEFCTSKSSNSDNNLDDTLRLLFEFKQKLLKTNIKEYADVKLSASGTDIDKISTPPFTRLVICKVPSKDPED